MSAGAVKAGQVYVEIGADPRAFFATINKINRQVGTIGRSISAAGSKIAGVGVGGLVPFAAAVRSGSQFESVLLNVKASAGVTEEQLAAVRAAAISMSQAMATGPTEIAGAFLELLKAGMKVEDVLGGAGDAAVQFAKVGGMDIAQAGVVMADAMNVFGVDAAKAANSISSAADASSTSIELLSQSFSMVSAVAALANQTIDDTSAALAVLANAGVKGSDAGTSLKTMLLRLMAPSDDAAVALEELGMSTRSFRDASGRMKPMVEIIGTLNDKLKDMDQAAKDDFFRRVFGADAIRAAAILTSTGVDGFNEMRKAMTKSLPVGEKFRILMSGLAGSGQAVMASLERAAVAITDAVGPALKDVGRGIVEVVNGLTVFIGNNRELVVSLAKSLVAAVGVGTAMTGLGLSLRLASYGMGGLIKAAAVAVSPLTLTARAALFVGSSFANVTGQLGGFAGKGISSVLSFATRTGLGLAKASSGFGSLAVNAAASAASVSASLTGSALAGILQFVRAGVAGLAQYSAQSTALIAVTASKTGSMAIAQTAATVSVISASVARAAEGNMRAASIGVQALVKLGVAGTTNALVGSQAIARLGTNGSRSMLALGTNSTTALARIGTTALTVSGASSGALTKAAASSALAMVRSGGLSAASIGGISRAASETVRVTVTGFTYAARSVASASMQAASSFSGASIAAFAKSSAAGVVAALRTGAVWVASLAKVTAATAISGVAMAASFLAPFAAIGVAIAGAGLLAYQFRGEITSALSSAGQLAGEAAGVIGSSFSVAVADAAVVFNDLYATAQTTFTGIYAAVAEGDLAGAMDILWEGLQAGWLRGSAALMSYVDPWISLLQNAFTILGAEIYKTWDSLWTDVGGALNTAAAYLLGAFDNVINPLLAAWDTLEAGIRKSWNRVQSLFKGGFDLKAENDKVDSEMDARRRSRELERGGIAGRTAAAEAANAESERARQDRAAAVDANTEATIAGREAANAANATKRQQEAAAAQSGLEASVRGRRESKVQGEQFARLLDDIKKATTLDQLRDAYGEFDALSSNGRLTTIQSDTLESALEDAQERITAATMSGGGRASEIRAGAGAAGSAAAQSKSDVAGTFSSSLGGMGFGSSLGERQLDALKQIAANTANLEGPATVAP